MPVHYRIKGYVLQVTNILLDATICLKLKQGAGACGLRLTGLTDRVSAVPVARLAACT